MRKNERIKRLINRYGQTVCAETESGERSPDYKAFVQPVRYKNKMYLNAVESPIGTVSENYYLYVGPYDVQLNSVNEPVNIHTAIMTCTVERTECVFLDDEILYIWAILRRVIEDE